MSKAVKVTNVDPTNSAKVEWAETRTGPYHNDTLVPGQAKTCDLIGSGGSVKVTAITGTVAVTIEDIGAVDVAVTQTVGSTLAAAGVGSYSIDPANAMAGVFNSVSVG